MSGLLRILFFISTCLILTSYQKFMSKGQGYFNNAKGKEGDEKKTLLKRSLKCYKKALDHSPQETKSFIRTRIKSIKSRLSALNQKGMKNSQSTSDEDKDIDEFLLKESTDVSFEDIGGLQDAKDYLRNKLIMPLDNPSLARKFGKTPVNGLLAYGPPGTGKTMLARAAATESEQASLIQITPSDILSKYLGDSESKVRKVFNLAIENAPSIVLFDEIESLATDRNIASANKRSIVNQILTEISNLNSENESHNPVLIIGTTNAPLLLDSAILRPGRLESKLYIGAPGPRGRKVIMERVLEQRKDVLKEKIDIQRLVELTEGYTGAECIERLNTVFEMGFRRSIEDDGEIKKIGVEEFIKVFKKGDPTAVETWKSEMQAKLNNNSIKDYAWLREVIEA